MVDIGILPTPEQLIVVDRDNLQSKLTNFTLQGSSGLHVVFDFDRTLTVRNPGSADDVTTWHILQEHLPEDGKREYRDLFKKYRPLELSGSMTRQDAVTWWSSILGIFVAHKIDLTSVEEDFLDKASIRPGTKELFDLCASNNIPTVILSAGIRDVIDIWCRKYEVKPSLILSTSLIVDGNNRITGWEKDTLVHILNKSEASHPELLAIRTTRPKTLLVGDSLDDATMMAGEEDVIRVRIVDPRADEVIGEYEQQQTFEKFDAMIKSGTLSPLSELLELVIR